ncbi:MAG: lytic transglycosylase domain-containing protein [Thermoanaerobaculia bacterium]
MNEPRTRRSFKQRVLDGFDRSRLHAEVRSVRGGRKRTDLRKRYGAIAVGAIAVGSGMAVPLLQHGQAGVQTPEIQPQPEQTATTIIQQVTNEIPKPKLTPEHLTIITENTKENFFKTEIPFGSIIYHEAKKNDLPPELVAAVVQTESQFKPTARSDRGAVGLMQMLPRTGRWMGANNLTDPAQNVKAGAKYLKYLSERFDGNERKMIAAYNAGEGNVRRFGGIPPFKETRDYVRKVFDAREDFSSQVQDRVADNVSRAFPILER